LGLNYGYGVAAGRYSSSNFFINPLFFPF